MDIEKDLEKAKRQRIILFVAGAVALIAAFVFFIVCAAKYLITDVVPKASEHVDNVRLMEEAYGDTLQLDHYMEKGDFGYKEYQGGFYLNSERLKEQIMVDATGQEAMEDYLFLLYKDDIYAYFTDAFTACFPDAECEVEIMEWNWLHKTEFLKFEDYMKSMEGSHIYITMVYEEGKVPDPETFEAGMRQIKSELNYDISISAKELYSYCFEGHINSGEEDVELTVRDYYTQHYD